MLDPVPVVALRTGRVLRTLYPGSIRGASLRHLAKLGSDDQRSSDEMYRAQRTLRLSSVRPSSDYRTCCCCWSPLLQHKADEVHCYFYICRDYLL